MPVTMKRLLLIIPLLLTVAAYAQRRDSSVGTNRYFSALYDNDYFSASDQYYTQGVRFQLTTPFLRRSPLSKLLLPSGKGSLNYYSLAFVQDCFTPTSIRRDTVFTGDRPFGAIIYLGSLRVSNNSAERKRVTSEIAIGGIGPCAHCKETQENIHAWIGDIQPLGWQFQLSQDLLLNYYAKYELGLGRQRPNSDLTGFADASAGTVYNNLGLGFTARTGWLNPYFSSIGPARKNSAEAAGNRRIQFYLFTRAKAQGVLYNGALQGGMFNRNSIYTIGAQDVKRLVLSGFLGAVLVIKDFHIEYNQAFLSPEFRNGLSHGWGHINITTCF